ncbi:MAG: molybdopterin-binding protein [Mycoplasmatales bacterium]
MIRVNLQEAIGYPLAHDIVSIKETSKEVAFKRGHIIKDKDQKLLLSLGKQNIYILEPSDNNLIHEEDAAFIIFDTINNNDFICSEVSLGKVSFIANKEGFFTVNKELITKFNMLGDISLASIKDMTYVNKGDIVASVRIIPLFTTTSHIDLIKSFKDAKDMFSILTITNTNIHQITTGSEVYSKKIEDAFKPTIENKLEKFGLKVSSYNVVSDDKELIKEQINDSLSLGANIILVTGGMSVDPDDLTPGAIKDTGSNIIAYGTPIIPGSMFLYSKHNNTYILGLPGAVIFEDITAFDLLLPYALVNKHISKEDIMSMSVGGLL